MHDLTDSARIQEGIIYNNLCRKFISWFQRRLLNSTTLSLQNCDNKSDKIEFRIFCYLGLNLGQKFETGSFGVYTSVYCTNFSRHILKRKSSVEIQPREAFHQHYAKWLFLKNFKQNSFVKKYL